MLRPQVSARSLRLFHLHPGPEGEACVRRWGSTPWLRRS
jgi:hypothetical protein